MLRAPRAELTRVGTAGAAPHVHLLAGLDRCRGAPLRAPGGRRPAPRPLRAASGGRCSPPACSDPAVGGWEELRRRAAAAIASDPLEAKHLALTGDDLVAELGIAPGPGHRAAPGGPARGGPRGSDAELAGSAAGHLPARWRADRALLQSAIRSACPRADDLERRPDPAMTAPRRTARLEHRLTRPNASLAELDAAIGLALEQELASLAVSPWLVRAAARAARRAARSRVATRDRLPARRPGGGGEGLRGVEGARRTAPRSSTSF